MFSALRQGSIVYVLDKGEHPSLKIGQVVSATQPNYGNNFLMNGSTIDLTVKIGDGTVDFKNVPAQLSLVNYNQTVVAETKELISNEVDNMLLNSRSILDSVSYHENVIKSCEDILKDLNPRFAKEKERDEDITNLKNKMGGIESKMDKILRLLTKDETK